jgi:hypothetical protein
VKRHPALQDLSRDHYFVLVEAQKIRRAFSIQAPSEDLDRLAAALVRFYKESFQPHLAEEAMFVLPAAMATGDPGLEGIEQEVRRRHSALAQAFEDLSAALRRHDDPRAVLGGIEALLVGTVRYEEEHLFEGLQRALPEAELRDLWSRASAFRKVNRKPDECGLGPEKGKP